MKHGFQLQEVTRVFRQGAGLWDEGREVTALDRLNLDLPRGSVCGLVGESGSGKSTVAKLMTGFDRPTSGEIRFEGRLLEDWIAQDRRGFSRKVQLIFQDPYLSLDPRWSVRRILAEGILGTGKTLREKRIIRALEDVQLPHACLERLPSQMSGGERQRVAIARALVVEPEYLLLDEPTSALDVSVQAEIVLLLKSLKSRFSGGMLFISHDLSLVRELVDEIVVLFRGRQVERGACDELLGNPREDYTKRLLQAVLPWPPKSKEGGSCR